MVAQQQQIQTPIKVLIAAMGGEGGGTLTRWIVNAARSQDLPVQATSVPGVAQRSGATTYYIEILPIPDSQLNGHQPVLDLYPTPGDLDLVVASELLEAGRVIKRGFVSPDKTTLVASTHRVYSLVEKMKMGDGRYGGEAVAGAAGKMAKQVVLFDIQRAALAVGGTNNSVILGAVAGTGILPIEPAVLENGIVQENKAVEENLAGFAAGMAWAEIKNAGSLRAGKMLELNGQAQALAARIKRTFTSEVWPVVLAATERCLDYQDTAYANLFLDRLDTVAGYEAADAELIRQTARVLGLFMTYEDIPRVAQLKSRAARIERLRCEVGAGSNQIVRVTEFLKPRPEELAHLLPPFIGKVVARWADANPAMARRFHFRMAMRSDTVLGYVRLRLLVALRRFRPLGYRFGEEQKFIQNWLTLVRGALENDPLLAREAVACGCLIKGYGDTYKRTAGNFTRIMEALIQPAIDGAPFMAEDLAKAREAALVDPQGAALARALAEIANSGAGVTNSAT
jgi:indolepyruvate ferredoxin oxidoreductase beta subunit